MGMSSARLESVLENSTSNTSLAFKNLRSRLRQSSGIANAILIEKDLVIPLCIGLFTGVAVTKAGAIQ